MFTRQSRIKRIPPTPKMQIIVVALLVGIVGSYLLISSKAATACTTTLNIGANVQNALSGAAPGAVVCLNTGNWPAQTISDISPSGMVTLQPAPGATVHINGITLNGPGNIKNLTVQGFYIDNVVQGLCGITGNVVFQYNTLQNISHDFGFYFYANGCGNGHTQTGVSMLHNQIDHVGDCLTVAGGSGIESNFTFNDNVCGPGVGKGATLATDPSHYIEIGGINGITANNNSFEGPMDANYVTALLHNNVFHIFGSSSNVDFSHNIVWHTQSRAQTILMQEGTFSNVNVDNNLMVEDPGCFENTDCYTESMEILAPHGMTVTNNTVVESGLGLRFGETCNNGCSATGNTMTLQNNVAEPVSRWAENYAIWNCASACTADHNVSADTSAIGGSPIKNWSPSYVTTSWTPHNGEPYSPPPTGYYVAKGLSFQAGWDGTGGPQGEVGAAGFNGNGGTTTLPPADTTPPVVSLTAPANNTTVSGSSVAVSAAASDNTGITGVQFKLDGNNLGPEDMSPPYSVAWNTTIATNGTHFLTALARDAAGNTKTAATITVIVNNAPPADTIAPTIPTNAKATVNSSTQVTVLWDASTDTGGSGLSGYNIYRNGSKLNGSSLITATSYTDNTAVPATAYTYKLEAVDGAGNKSIQSTAVNVTTPAATSKGGDVTGPAGTPDGKIDLYDLSYIIRNYGTTNSRADVTGTGGTPDGKVDIYDVSYIIRSYQP